MDAFGAFFLLAELHYVVPPRKICAARTFSALRVRCARKTSSDSDVACGPYDVVEALSRRCGKPIAPPDRPREEEPP